MTQDSLGARTSEVWILGATGRIGHAAARLAARGVDLVLVGRDRESLRKVAAHAGRPEAKIIVTDSAEQMAAEISRRRPAVSPTATRPTAPIPRRLRSAPTWPQPPEAPSSSTSRPNGWRLADPLQKQAPQGMDPARTCRHRHPRPSSLAYRNR